jgi:anti-anti-sigma regulatory factor
VAHPDVATAVRRQVVHLRGPLTAACSDHLLGLLRTVKPVPTQVEIDLSHVTRVDRFGAALLLDAYVATLLRQRTFALSGPSTLCRQSLKRFGVLDVVDLIDPSERDHALWNIS